MIKTRCRCGAKYAFDDASSGKRAKCRKCGEIFTVESPPNDPGEIINLAPEPPLYSEFAAAADRERANRPRQRKNDELGTNYDLAEAAIAGVHRAPRLEDDTEGPGPRGYGANLLWAALFPTNVNNAIILGVVVVLMALSELILPWAGCIGTIGQLIITGWFCAFRFQIIADAANGEEDLPTLVGGEGVFEDIVLPLLRWIACWLIILAPALTLCVILHQAGTFAGVAPPTSLDDLITLSGASIGGFAALVFLGVFCWPMLALCVAIGGFATLSRVDLMFATVFRTFPVYALTVGLVLLLDAIPIAAAYAMPAPNPAGGIAASINAGLAAGALAVVLNVYTEILAAKAIGLYYHHFKQRFAWSWG